MKFKLLIFTYIFSSALLITSSCKKEAVVATPIYPIEGVWNLQYDSKDPNAPVGPFYANLILEPGGTLYAEFPAAAKFKGTYTLNNTHLTMNLINLDDPSNHLVFQGEFNNSGKLTNGTVQEDGNIFWSATREN